MMDIKDAHKVIENLQTRPFICSENTMELDNDYVIVKKEFFKELTERQPKIGEWIPFSERFPKENKKLIIVKNGRVIEDIFDFELPKDFQKTDCELKGFLNGTTTESFSVLKKDENYIFWKYLNEVYHE